LPGAHNVLNALAAIAFALELEIDVDAVRRALESFSGIDRWLQVLGTVTTRAGDVTFVDDYGHHPTEIAATIAAAKGAWRGRRLVVVFQPHRYTRTHALLDDFAQVLSEADALILTNVYAAGEPPIVGADGKALARAVRARGKVEPILVDELDEIAGVLEHVVEGGDVVLTLGAGSIGTLAPQLPAALALKRPLEAGKGARSWSISRLSKACVATSRCGGTPRGASAVRRIFTSSPRARTRSRAFSPRCRKACRCTSSASARICSCATA